MNRVILISLTSLGLAACGQAAAGSAPTAPPPPVSAVVHVASSPALGTILTTADGRTLYYFTPERGGTIACTDQCVQAWPPFLTASGLLSTPVALPGTLATVRRAEGVQVTYSEWPLYTFAGDKSPGDTNGQGVLGKWFVALTTLTDAPVATATPQPPAPVATAPPAPPVVVPPPIRPTPAPTSCIPGMNGGDHDGDNNGGPNDFDGCK